MQNYVFNYGDYNKKIHKPTQGGMCVIVFIIICLLGVACFLNQTKPSYNQFYFVEIKNFLTYKDATNLATEIQAKNGAGYVYFDGSYHVLASFYPTKKEAETVCNNLKNDYPSSQVFELNYNKLSKFKNLSQNQNNAISAVNLNLYNAIENLYSCIIKYDTSNIGENELAQTLNKLHSAYKDEYNNFLAQFSNNSKYNKAKTNLEDINSTLNNLSNVTSEQNISYKLKYNAIKIVVDYSSFLSCF